MNGFLYANRFAEEVKQDHPRSAVVVVSWDENGNTYICESSATVPQMPHQPLVDGIEFLKIMHEHRDEDNYVRLVDVLGENA
jgi:hypothetical protein